MRTGGYRDTRTHEDVRLWVARLLVKESLEILAHGISWALRWSGPDALLGYGLLSRVGLRVGAGSTIFALAATKKTINTALLPSYVGHFVPHTEIFK